MLKHINNLKILTNEIIINVTQSNVIDVSSFELSYFEFISIGQLSTIVFCDGLSVFTQYIYSPSDFPGNVFGSEALLVSIAFHSLMFQTLIQVGSRPPNTCFYQLFAFFPFSSILFSTTLLHFSLNLLYQ